MAQLQLWLPTAFTSAGGAESGTCNWGVIVPIQRARAPKFSPVYDTARALFWNIPESRVRQMLTDGQQLEKYVNNCLPPIGCDKEPNVDFFRLIGLIWEHFEGYRHNIEKFLPYAPLNLSFKLVDNAFGRLFSKELPQLLVYVSHVNVRKFDDRSELFLRFETLRILKLP